MNELGWAYSTLGETKKAMGIYQEGLIIARENKDRQAEGVWLGNLGGAYAALGNARKAIEFYEQALVIAREIGDKRGEGNRLGNLGGAYAALGDARKAIEFYEQALVIAREIGDKRNEGNWLGNMGNSYADLGDARKAIEFYEQALGIDRKIGDHRGEAADLVNTGHVLLGVEEYEKGQENIRQGVQIADEISYQPLQQYSRWELTQAYLFQNDLVNARATIEAALGYDVPEYNHNASALHGIIALRQGDEVTARGAFVRAIGQADEILSKTAEYYSALDAKGLSICGLLICDLQLKGRGAVPAPDGATTTGRDDLAPTIDDAIETFRKARKIAPHAGVVKSVLRLFDELVKCDKDGVLKDVRKAAEGK